MLLQVVALSLNVRHQSFSGRQLDTGDFSLGGVGLLGRGDDQTGDDALALGTRLEQRRAGLNMLFGHPLRADGLVHCAQCRRRRVEGTGLGEDGGRARKHRGTVELRAPHRGAAGEGPK